MTTDANDLATKATKVAELAARQKAAFDEEREAKEVVLRAALDAVRPALEAISSRLTDDLRGVVLARAETGPVRTLFLLSDGDLIGFGNVNLMELSVSEALGHFDLNEILESLDRALQAQLSGNAELRIEQAEARAEKLRALVLLARES
jgi:hypothetical protein